MHREPLEHNMTDRSWMNRPGRAIRASTSDRNENCNINGEKSAATETKRRDGGSGMTMENMLPQAQVNKHTCDTCEASSLS